MELNLPVTLAIVALIAGLFAFANWRSRQPAQPLKVRMINYHVVQLLCIVLLLVMGSHLLTLWLGHPVTGQRTGGAPF
jgi:hypothetical protein